VSSHKGKLHYLPYPSALHAVDARTGTTRWQYPSGNSTTNPVVADGTVFTVVGSTLVALDSRTGARQWTRPVEEPISRITLTGDFVCVQGRTKLYAVGVRSGDPAWTFPLHGEDYAEVAHVPELGVILLGTLQNIRALKAQTGSPIWRFPLIEEDPKNGRIKLASIGGVTYVRTDRIVHALGTATGKKKWDFTLNGPGSVGTLVASKDTVYFGNSGTLYSVAA
jgi:outer membrane protein assembly factor BamB